MKIKILIVDDLHEVLFEKLDHPSLELHYHPDITKEESEQIIHDFDGLITRSKFAVDRTFMKRAPKLRFIAKPTAGIDNIDEEAAKELGITLISSNAGNCDAMAEHMLSMLLCLMNNLNRADQQVRAGQWLREANRGHELKGKTVAIIGYGHNGQAMAQKLSGFGVKVIAYDKYKTGFSDAYAQEVSMEEVVRQADVLSLHIPLTRETRGMVDDEYFLHFRKPIFLLMGARGGIVDMDAAVRALESGKIIAAAFDVLPVEKFPQLEDQPWFQRLRVLDNVLFTPHVAGWTFESYYKLAVVLSDKVLTFLSLADQD